MENLSIAILSEEITWKSEARVAVLNIWPAFEGFLVKSRVVQTCDNPAHPFPLFLLPIGQVIFFISFMALFFISIPFPVHAHH